LFTAYSGPWLAGQTYRYPFKLNVAKWPPTYYGTYLNVSHSVRARAKISWAKDPTAEREFAVVVDSAPTDVQPERKKAQGKGCLLGWILAVTLLLFFLFAFIWLVPILLVVGGVIWFFRSYLPKQLTGTVIAEIQPERLKPGQELRGRIEFTPKRRLKASDVLYKIECIEKCVSGSGSNRKTHKHELLSLTEKLAPASHFAAGQQQKFEFIYTVPVDAAPSMKLNDNELTWSVQMRIAIPRWPDWTKDINFIVEPSSHGPLAARDGISTRELPPEDAWLKEVLDQLEQSDDLERRQLVLAAIQDHQFTLPLTFEDFAKFGPVKHSQLPGRWIDAYFNRRDWTVVGLVPPEVQLPPQGDTWLAPLTILDFDPDEELLVVKLLPPSAVQPS
jgi:hypothetical protein